MLYSTIPPILVVLSVIGIILFFMKKAPDVSKLEEDLAKEKENENFVGANGFSGMKQSNGGKWIFIKQKLLTILEIIIRKLRVIFLKLENSVTGWSNKIKEKRGAQFQKKTEVLSQEDSIVEKLKQYEAKEEVEKEELESVTEEVAIRLTDPVIPETVREKPVRPMVSERVAVPNVGPRKKKEQEIKDRLEELLIERIAANPRDTEAYERLGEYYLDVENLEHAKECFKQILKLDPTNRSVKYKMKKLERMLGK